MPEPDLHERQLHRAFAVILVLASTSLGLLVGVVYLLMVWPAGSVSLPASLGDPGVRERVIAQLVADHQGGAADSHVDADVGRILQPDLQHRLLESDTISTNRFGLRERDYVLPKPDSLIRIVLLGDSFVHGSGVAAEERLGALLQPWLWERSPGFEGRIEVLHLGIPSWNFTNATAYLRRQLSDLQPDLVLHIAVPNDVDDGMGVRGFGQRAAFSPQVRYRADSIINPGFPIRVLGFSRPGYVRYGIDYEGQSRYRTARSQIQRLAEAVESAGGQYRLIFHYGGLLQAAWMYLGRHLNPAQAVYLSSGFASDRQYWVSETNPHWNRDGHATMARLLYGLIVRDALLPEVNPAPWDEAARTLDEIAGAGRADAQQDFTDDERLAHGGSTPPLIASRIDFDALTDDTAAQIHGGVDRLGYVSPYASLVLKNTGARHLHLEGRSLPRPELDGTRVQVFIDADEVGTMVLQAGTPLDVRFPLPAQGAARPYLSVRLLASDYGYQGRNLQHCVVFEVKRIALEQ